MGREAQLLLVAPKDLGTGPDGRSGQELVEVGNLILAMIADQNQHGPLAGHDGALDERADARVELLPDHMVVSDLIPLSATARGRGMEIRWR